MNFILPVIINSIIDLVSNIQGYYENAINGYNEFNNTKEIQEKLKKFLEEIEFKGACEFDLKYDIDDDKFKVLEIPTAIVVAAAPETIPQISPITSLQKLATLSAFFLNITAILAPFTLLEFIEWKTFSSALVTETPIISKIIPIKINNKVISIPQNIDKLGIVVCDTKDNENEIIKVIIN